MKKGVIVIILICLFIGCNSDIDSVPDMSRAKYFSTNRINEDLKVDVYVETNGAYLDNDYYYFIAANASPFNYYVGSHDDHGRIFLELINDDSLWVHHYVDALDKRPSNSELYIVSKYLSNLHPAAE